MILEAAAAAIAAAAMANHHQAKPKVNSHQIMHWNSQFQFQNSLCRLYIRQTNYLDGVRGTENSMQLLTSISKCAQFHA